MKVLCIDDRWVIDPDSRIRNYPVPKFGETYLVTAVLHHRDLNADFYKLAEFGSGPAYKVTMFAPLSYLDERELADSRIDLDEILKVINGK